MAKNTDLIPESTLKTIEDFNIKIGLSIANMVKLAEEAVKVNDTLRKSGSSFKDLYDAINKADEVTRKLNEETVKSINYSKEKEKLTQKAIAMESEEYKALERTRIELANKRKEVREAIKEEMNLSNATKIIVKDLSGLNDELSKGFKMPDETAESQVKRFAVSLETARHSLERLEVAPELAASLQTAEDGSVKFNNAISEGSMRLESLSHAQNVFMDALDKGLVTQEEYKALMESANGIYEKQSQQLAGITAQRDQETTKVKTLASISSDAYNTINASLQEYYRTLIETETELAANKAQQKELDDLYKGDKRFLDEYTTAKATLKVTEDNLRQAMKNTSDQIKYNTQLANSSVGSYENLSAQYALLKIRINQMGEAEGQNVKVKRDLEKQAETLYKKMDRLQSATGKHQLNVGNYSGAVKDLTKTVGLLNGSVGGSISKAKEFGSTIITAVKTPVGAATLAFGALIAVTAAWIGAQKSNIGTGREFNATMDGMNSALDYAKTAFAQIDFTNFIEGLKNAYNVGKQVSYELERIWELQNSLNILGSAEKAAIEDLKLEAQDANKPIQDRIFLLTKATAQTNEMYDKEVKIQQQRKDAAILNLAGQSKLTDEQREYYIDQNIQHRKQIDNANEIIALEKELDGVREYTRTDVMRIEIKGAKARKESLKDQIELKKQSADYDQMAYDAAKNYQDLDKERIGAYVKEGATLNALNVARNRDLRTLERMKQGLIKQSDTSDNKNLKQQESAMQQYNKMAARLRTDNEKAESESKALLFDMNADTQRAIVTDENKSYNERMAALATFQKMMEKSITERADKQQTALQAQYDKDKAIADKAEKEMLSFEETYGDQLLVIAAKTANELNRIEITSNDMRRDIQQDGAKEQIKRAEDAADTRNREISLAESDALKNLSGLYAAGTVNAEEYEKEKTAIAVQYAGERLQNEIDAINALLAISNLSGEQREALNKQLLDKQLEYAKFVNEQETQSLDDEAKKREKIEKKLAELKKQIWTESLNLLKQMVDASAEADLARLDKQSKENDKWREKEMQAVEDLEESGAITKEQADARKAAIDQQAQAREEEIEKRKKEIEIEQAKREKAISLVQTVVNTAQAVMKNTAQLGFPAAIPVNALTIALGAIQAATILAQPLPEYKEGTEDHPGGYGIVGDGGRPELIVTPSGKTYITPSVPTLVDMPEHSMVLPDIPPLDWNMYVNALNRPVELKMKENNKGLETEIRSMKDDLRKATEHMNRQNNRGHEAIQYELIGIRKYSCVSANGNRIG